jgi:hypothetical protein
MSWSKLKDEFEIDDIGGRLLANLAKGIYNHEAVLREYVQNAADAYQQLHLSGSVQAQPRISITVEDGALSVHDNGVGMDKKGIREAKKIAVSPKANANLTGFRGIGIWAGFQACDRLEIVTTKKGDVSRYRLSIDFKEILKHVDKDFNIKQLLDNRFRLEESPAQSAEHYTLVTLHGIHPEYSALLNPQELQRIVSQTLPCRVDPNFTHRTELEKFVHPGEGYQEFHVFVGNEEVFKVFPVDVRPPQFETIKDGSVEIAKVWWSSGTSALKTAGHEFRGFRLRVRNFAVGRVGIYDDEDGLQFGLMGDQSLKNSRRLDWFVGEIHVTNDQIVPDTPRNHLELDTRSRTAISRIRAFYSQRIAEAGALADFNSDEEAIEKGETLVAHLPLANGALEDAYKILQKLQKQEKLLAGKTPPELAKRKLRELLSDPALKKRRHELIKTLGSALSQPQVPGASPPDPPPAKEPPNKGPSGLKATPPKDTGAPPTQDSKMEQLLSEVLAVVAAKLDDEELVTEISKALQSLFETHDLI